MYGTVTRLTFRDRAAKAAALHGLGGLIEDAVAGRGVIECHVMSTGETEATMVTLYRSEAEAAALGASTRIHLRDVVGPHVRTPPERWAGEVELSARDDSRPPR